MAGESRSELLAWANELLSQNYTKIEQFGTGAAYCQIIDSIYGDVPMGRVKMNARQEYEYLSNYKILQNVFKSKKIDKPIPVDKLVKCKMQDNLEFLQWLRRFHDQSYGGGTYDAVGRRKGDLGGSGGVHAPVTAARAVSSGRVGGKTPVGGAARTSSAAANTELNQMRNQLAEMNIHLEGLERERDFYFAKLRDIEVIVQEKLGEPSTAEGEKLTLTQIQEILYSTEEGFEVPDAIEDVQPVDDETF